MTRIQPLLELKTRPKFRPVSWSLSMTLADCCYDECRIMLIFMMNVIMMTVVILLVVGPFPMWIACEGFVLKLLHTYNNTSIWMRSNIDYYLFSGYRTTPRRGPTVGTHAHRSWCVHKTKSSLLPKIGHK